MRRILLFLLLLFLFPARIHADTDVHFPDVGQGLCVLIRSGGYTILYDGGGPSASDPLSSYLDREGITSIDLLIASHYDADHVDGLVRCLQTVPVRFLFGPDYVSDSPIYPVLTDTAAAAGKPLLHPAVGDTYAIGEGFFTVLGPSETFPGDNNNSLILKFTFGDISFLLTGDAETEEEEQLENSGIDLSADVLCIPHHGSSSSTSPALLEAVSPAYAVISCGTDNPYGHPHIETLDRLRKKQIQILRTDLQGNLIAHTDGRTLSWNKAPCNDYTPGSPIGNAADFSFGFYILNTASFKFHLNDCSAAAKISPSNRAETFIQREELLLKGYIPCRLCSP